MTKKSIFITALAAFLTLSAPAFAGWQQDIQAAINSKNFHQVDVIAASNPGAQGEIALFLLQQAQSKLASNPELAAQIFASANPFVNQINAPKNTDAAAVLLSMVSTAKDGGFQQKNCVGALTILGAALSMSTLPNISSVAPNLHAITLAAANDSLESKPLCDTKSLQDEVSLAETPGTPPRIGPGPVITPSAD
jgi:hypothetical protein